MKTTLSWVLAGLCALGSTSCIYVHVKGDLDEEFFDHGDFSDLSRDLERSLSDPAYDLDISASLWRTQAEWTVKFAEAGSDGDAAFKSAKEAVLRRIEREGGQITEQSDEGPRAWNCEFRTDGEPGEASVRWVPNEGDARRPHRLEIRWDQTD